MPSIDIPSDPPHALYFRCMSYWDDLTGLAKPQMTSAFVLLCTQSCI